MSAGSTGLAPAPPRQPSSGGLVLLAGATGYLGGRLLASLERERARVRCLARRPEVLAGRVASSNEVVRGDCLEPESLPQALSGVDTAYCVEGYEEPRLLRLAAEMRLPGRAWLQFEVKPMGASRSQIRQTAIFDPAGLAGLLCWYALYPTHSLIFGGMLRGIAARARTENDTER